jgi:hypothetical protein
VRYSEYCHDVIIEAKVDGVRELLEKRPSDVAMSNWELPVGRRDEQLGTGLASQKCA